MELDGETTRQLFIAGLAVAVFVVAAIAVSTAFGSAPTVNTPTEGELNGTLTEGAISDGTINGEFSGTLDGDVQGTVEGTIEGSLDDAVLNGTIEGTVDGTIEGRVNVTSEPSGSVVAGTFNGTITGTDSDTDVTATGGIALVGVLAAFILLMAGAGLWLARQDFDS